MECSKTCRQTSSPQTLTSYSMLNSGMLWYHRWSWGTPTCFTSLTSTLGNTSTFSSESTDLTLALENLTNALLHGLVDGMQHRFPVDVCMSTEVEARGCDNFAIFELISITVSNVEDTRIDDFSEHLWDLWTTSRRSQDRAILLCSSGT